ncbi:hypothetical protein CCR75_004698 [Bremia lactucae]|uniref:Uncharacterized protein n=1 Tax=Bremia lactucae TaxID=4779 RepID=A0A976IJH4_BRELC|nr:hypothetical protein CCR75_004698 [Bremia lactucae]
MDEASVSASAAFNLYQEGLAPEQILQLCFLRRRASRNLRLERIKIEDEFVLPRPELKIANVLPPTNISFKELLTSSSVLIKPCDNEIVAQNTSERARDSARRHFLQPQQAAAEEVRQWSALAKSDWLEIFNSSQGGQNYGMMRLNADAVVPSISDICWVMEQCPSEAFIGFVWEHLLALLLQQRKDLMNFQRFISRLVAHDSISLLSPKDFRAKVRARNLREVDDTLGAQAELALISVYRLQRESRF